MLMLIRRYHIVVQLLNNHSYFVWTTALGL